MAAPLDRLFTEVSDAARLQEAPARSQGARVRAELLLVAVLAGLLAIAFATWLSGRIARLIREVRGGLLRLAEGDLTWQPPARRPAGCTPS
jgi:methyl-accepting chemotaxis protein